MKKIGILGWKVGANSFGITLPYFRYASRFGEVHIIEPNNILNTELDLLILPGGPDLSPHLVNADKFDIDIQRSCPIRTYFADNRLQQYIDAKVPMFGICLGHQMLASHVGCTIDLNMFHETNEPDERYKTVHELTFNDEWDIKETRRMKVNSLHHQAIPLSGIKNVEVIATHKERKDYKGDNHVEALKYNDFPAYSVQWHPEEINDRLSDYLILELLDYQANKKKIKQNETKKYKIGVEA